MKKFFVFFALAAALAGCVLIGGAAGNTVSVTVCIDGEESLTGDYKTALLPRLEVLFCHRGDYTAFCEKKYLGDGISCLGSLNAQLAADIVAESERHSYAAVQAEAVFSDGEFEYTAEADGRVLSADALAKALLREMGRAVTVSVESTVVAPSVTVEQLKRDTVKTASFSTTFSAENTNRRDNIVLAAKKLNGVVVETGETLSFNRTVGERTEANGFRTAHIIKDGEFVAGVGGGVCQVSTTLFDCWLLAGLGCESAAAHSLPVSYVRPALDAMVSEGTDLVLRNDSGARVYLRVLVEGARLTVEIYGRPCGYEVRLRSETIKRLPAEYEEESVLGDWQDGETERVVKKAIDGLVADGYRDYYSDGQLVRTEFLRRKTYLPQKGRRLRRKSTLAGD